MSAMNPTVNFPNGTRVAFHEASGEVRYGVVQGTSVLADGTIMIIVKPDGGGATINLPAAALIRT